MSTNCSSELRKKVPLLNHGFGGWLWQELISVEQAVNFRGCALAVVVFFRGEVEHFRGV